MISRVSRTFAANRLVIATGVLNLLLTVALIPVGIFPNAFDKNAPIQFLMLAIIAVIFSTLIIKRRNHFVFSGKVIWALWITFLALILSAIFSPDFIGSMTGDTGPGGGKVFAIASGSGNGLNYEFATSPVPSGGNSYLSYGNIAF